jgi:hypothetical protein
MAIEVGRQFRLEVATTLASAITTTAVSKASEAVVTATNTFSNGDWVLWGAVDGMTELSYLVARVKSVSGSGFTLEGVNSTAWGTWVSGTCQKISTWSTLAAATSIDFGAGSVDSLDATTLIDVSKQNLAGLLTIPDVSVNLFTDYSVSVQAAIDVNAMAGTVTAFRASKASGHTRGWSGQPSLIGESVNVNQIISGSLNIVVRSTRYLKYTT